MAINKKNHINSKCSLLNKTLHSVKSEIFSIKLWRKLTKFYPMTIISADHENEIQFFQNHLPSPRILKMIRQNKWFNPPVYGTQEHFQGNFQFWSPSRTLLYIFFMIEPKTKKKDLQHYGFLSTLIPLFSLFIVSI